MVPVRALSGPVLRDTTRLSRLGSTSTLVTATRRPPPTKRVHSHAPQSGAMVLSSALCTYYLRAELRSRGRLSEYRRNMHIQEAAAWDSSALRCVEYNLFEHPQVQHHHGECRDVCVPDQPLPPKV